MQNWFFIQSAEYGKYYIEVDVNDYGTYNIWIGMLNSDGSVGNPVDELTTSNKSSARRKYNKFIQDAETDSYGWNSHTGNPTWKFDTNTSLNSIQEYILSNPKNIKASSNIRRDSNMKKYVKASTIVIDLQNLLDNGVRYLSYGGKIIDDGSGYVLYRDDDIDGTNPIMYDGETIDFEKKYNISQGLPYYYGVTNSGKGVYLTKEEYDILANGETMEHSIARKYGKYAVKSSTDVARITDLPDDTVIHVDEVFDYVKKYMKPEDIDHHGHGHNLDDLYLRVNDVSKWIVDHLDNKSMISRFIDNIDHVWWYEFPFLYFKS